MENKTEKIKDAPAPWSLTGQLAYLFVHGSRRAYDSFNENPDPNRSPFRGGFGGVLLIRYTDSPVGPYDELILIPGCYQFGNQSYYRITQIYVSSKDSAVNGRKNWGVPKKVARFQWNDDNTFVQIYLPDAREPFCTMRIRPRFYCLPVNGRLVPSSFRSLLQLSLEQENLYLKTIPSATGWFRPIVQLIEFQTDGQEIPSSEQIGLYTYGVGYEEFTLIFPEAEQILT